MATTTKKDEKPAEVLEGEQINEKRDSYDGASPVKTTVARDVFRPLDVKVPGTNGELLLERSGNDVIVTAKGVSFSGEDLLVLVNEFTAFTKGL